MRTLSVLLLLLGCALLPSSLPAAVEAGKETTTETAPLPQFTAGMKGTKAGEVCINPRDGAEMVWVPAGEFSMGIDAAMLKALQEQVPTMMPDIQQRESPLHTVKLDGFWIYRCEVTIRQYQAFCTARARRMPAAPVWEWQETHPIVNVSWDDARLYAQWAGARLPTEAQWEYAARGVDGRLFPWGAAWQPERCNHCDTGLQRTQPVGKYPDGNSPFGVADMAGNVWEWCQDWYSPTAYTPEAQQSPTGPPQGEARVVRGGGWGDDASFTRCTAREGMIPGTLLDTLGFRCVVIP